ncbi:PspA-associated protein PspAB [Nonomuraea soli]|uniref:Uncharacterized protein n=1 Tax=Nonomuraea soli TaxID=1032476 RepID=A0A7W0CED7_9ACTN|nr:hypothetical protein [Nonomuraea soli]MBA2889445.1 hypothetical protein [Nonomuraea soli]
MRWLDALLGRQAPAEPDLDALFALPQAAPHLEGATGLAPTGQGAVCFRAAEGRAFTRVQKDAKALLGSRVRETSDPYGYTWLTVDHPLDKLVAELHSVNSTLEGADFAPSLLCSAVAFANGSQRLAMVYLYRRGSFYPFAPLAGRGRDTALERKVAATLAGDLPVEPDEARWFALWDSPMA